MPGAGSKEGAVWCCRALSNRLVAGNRWPKWWPVAQVVAGSRFQRRGGLVLSGSVQPPAYTRYDAMHFPLNGAEAAMYKFARTRSRTHP